MFGAAATPVRSSIFNSAFVTLSLAAAAGSMACDDTNVQSASADLARLAVTNAGLLVGALLDDTDCGLSSAAVRDAVVITGRTGEPGTARFSVRRCVIDFDARPFSETDCEQRRAKLTGRVTVTATMTVSGVLTGDPRQPVLARAPDATRIAVTADVERLAGQVDGVDGVLTLREGRIRFEATPYLAVDGGSGLCTVPSRDLAILGLALDRVDTYVDSDEGDGYVYVGESSIDAQIGRGALGENSYSGSINVLGVVTALPIPGAEKLDPDYDRARFEAASACEPGATTPLRFDCDGRGPADREIAQGVARLSVQALASLSALVARDERCGFASANAVRGATVEGRPGEMGREVRRVRGCRLQLAPRSRAFDDCQGGYVEVEGGVVVDAEQVLTGVVTGDRDNPILPVREDPAVVRFERVELDAFGLRLVSDTASAAPSIRFLDGRMSGTLTPRFARGASVDACVVPTPIVRFDDVRLSEARTTLVVPGTGTVSVDVESAGLAALSGRWDGAVNTLTGTVTIDGQRWSVPTAAGEGLVPDFDEADFGASWACTTGLASPVSFECDPTDGVVDGVARLTPLAIGAIVPLIEADARCGFASAAATMATTAGGGPGSEADVTTRITGCRLELPRDTAIGTDCNGDAVIARGAVTVSGSRVIRGFVTGVAAQPVVPTAADATRYALQLDFDGFSARPSAAGSPGLTLATGRIDATVVPGLALDTSVGACTLPTPAARMSLGLRELEARVVSGGMTLGVRTSGSLEAESGPANQLSGRLSVGATEYTVPLDGSVLDPQFDAARYAASFACTPNLRVPAALAECSFRATLAPIVAGLTVQNLGYTVAMAVPNQTCGFASPAATLVDATPRDPPPQAGVPGATTWAILGCALSGSAMTPLQEDCLRQRTFVTGNVTVTATQSVQGLRVDPCQGPVCVPLAVPLSREGVQLQVGPVHFANLLAYTLPAGDRSPAASLAMLDGSAWFELQPIMGENSQTPMVFDVVTPVARFHRVRVRGARVMVSLEGRRFGLTIDDSELEASVGIYQGAGNALTGWISLDGQRVELPPGTPLDPDYEQTRFDTSYDCTPGLAATIPPN
jgi:hypothetical protein